MHGDPTACLHYDFAIVIYRWHQLLFDKVNIFNAERIIFAEKLYGLIMRPIAR
jgi:hypothetical protein